MVPWAWSPSGCPLSWTLVRNAGPWHGTLLGTLPEVTYRPAPGYCGSDSFQFRVSDGGQESEPATVRLHVGDPNPAAHCQDVMTGVNTPVAFTLSGADACSDELTFRVKNPPAHGQITAFDPESGQVTYVPDNGYEGPDEFWFSAANCGFESAWQWVRIRVVPPPIVTAACGPDGILLRWVVPPWVGNLITDIQIKRKVAGVSYGVIATLPADARSYVDTAVSPGVTYCYVVVIRRQDSCTDAYYGVESSEVCASPCSLPPCDQPLISGWVFTDQGFVAGNQEGAFRTYTDPASVPASPWSLPASLTCTTSAPNALRLRMDFENDNNCPAQHGPPNNPYRQIATAEAVIALSCPTRLRINWCGLGERHQSLSYELMTMQVGEDLLADAHSPGDLGTQCEAGMGPTVPRSESPVPPQERVLPAGLHLLSIRTDTGDWQYHFGAYYEFELRLQPE